LQSLRADTNTSEQIMRTGGLAKSLQSQIYRCIKYFHLDPETEEESIGKDGVSKKALNIRTE
jgi:hypothetical protein